MIMQDTLRTSFTTFKIKCWITAGPLFNTVKGKNKYIYDTTTLSLQMLFLRSGFSTTKIPKIHVYFSIGFTPILWTCLTLRSVTGGNKWYQFKLLYKVPNMLGICKRKHCALRIFTEQIKIYVGLFLFSTLSLLWISSTWD